VEGSFEHGNEFSGSCKILENSYAPVVTFHLFSSGRNNTERSCLNLGRVIAQTVSRRLPNAAACVRARIRSYGISGGQNGTGADFLRVLQFPLPILIPPTAPHSSPIIRGWYNRPVSGRRTKWA
jgi:hypothetical protein